MKLLHHIEQFFQGHSEKPFLLAFSGGSDSMALFHCLVSLSKKFRIAHVDHGWRPESAQEAAHLQEMAHKYSIPFHLKRLDPSNMRGNLEANCRIERYAFFKEICQGYHLEGVMTAHHQGDQAETILKRVLEGSHWTNLPGLQPVSAVDGLKLFRPLLAVPKKEITKFLDEAKITFFDDATNRDVKFLRAKMRHAILPWLNEAFGKDVQSALIHLGSEMQEMRDHLEELLQPYLSQCQYRTDGVYLELKEGLPHKHIVKALIRRLCEENDFMPSRQILDQTAQACINGAANKKFMMGGNTILVSCGTIFVSAAARRGAQRYGVR